MQYHYVFQEWLIQCLRTRNAIKSDPGYPGKQAFPDPRGVARLAFLSLATCVPQNTVELPQRVSQKSALHCYTGFWALQIQWANGAF